jgi:formamidopyrimidine-DNA glycosylase
MPELPEVESIKRYLSNQVIGRTITSFSSDWPKAIDSHSLVDFTSIINGQSILDLKRHGKYLVFYLRSGQNLMIHLRLTGHLDFSLDSTKVERYTRHTFGIDNNFEMRLRDMRKFATISLASKQTNKLQDLGQDPLDASFTAAHLEDLLHSHRASIKSFLLNQSIIAGIGTIYSDEILFECKIHPSTPTSSVPTKMVQHLHKTMITILTKATESLTEQIVRNKTTPRWNASSPSFSMPRKAGLPCPECENPVKRITLSGRATYFCVHCQSTNEAVNRS